MMDCIVLLNMADNPYTNEQSTNVYQSSSSATGPAKEMDTRWTKVGAVILIITSAISCPLGIPGIVAGIALLRVAEEVEKGKINPANSFAGLLDINRYGKITGYLGVAALGLFVLFIVVYVGFIIAMIAAQGASSF